MARRVAAWIDIRVTGTKLGTMLVISSLKSGKDLTIFIALTSISSSTISQTVFVCAKVAWGSHSTCLKTANINQLRNENKTKWKNKLHGKNLWKEAKETKSKAIQALGTGIFTFSAETPKMCPIRTDTTLDLDLAQWMTNLKKSL